MRRANSPRCAAGSVRGAAPDRLLDVRAAAALLAVKPATLYQWAYQRRIPVVKLMGRALRFRESDLRKVIAEGVRPALGHNHPA
jgi:excisionase family DNA binding protein